MHHLGLNLCYLKQPPELSKRPNEAPKFSSSHCSKASGAPSGSSTPGSQARGISRIFSRDSCQARLEPCGFEAFFKKKKVNWN